jgi:transcriptional regulator with XRE-family HTH domain
MVSIDRALSEFIDDWNAGRRPQVDAYLDRVAEADRTELADRLMTWLEVAPEPAYDEAARDAIAADPIVQEATGAMASESGLWPALLPRLRSRAGLSLRELAVGLVRTIGLGGDTEAKTERYLGELEAGELNPERVSRRVLYGLAGVLRVNVSLLEEASGGAFRPEPMFRATTPPRGDTTHNLEVLADMLSAPTPEEGWDEVDQLFRGGR